MNRSHATKLTLMFLSVYAILGPTLVLANDNEPIPPAKPIINPWLGNGIAAILLVVILFIGFLSSRRGHHD